MVQSVPGHNGVTRNERVDELAKIICRLLPERSKITLANYYRTVKQALTDKWVQEWRSADSRGQYTTADKMPPSTVESYPFRQLD